MSQRPGMMPVAAVQPISEGMNGNFPFITVKSSNNSNHLLVLKTVLKLKLIVANTGICILCLYNPVKNVCPILPLIKWQIIFLQFFRQG